MHCIRAVDQRKVQCSAHIRSHRVPLSGVVCQVLGRLLQTWDGSLDWMNYVSGRVEYQALAVAHFEHDTQPEYNLSLLRFIS